MFSDEISLYHRRIDVAPSLSPVNFGQQFFRLLREGRVGIFFGCSARNLGKNMMRKTQIPNLSSDFEPTRPDIRSFFHRSRCSISISSSLRDKMESSLS